MRLYNPYALVTDEPLTAAGRVLRFPRYCLWCAGGLLSSWLVTRHIRWLLEGVPVIVLSGCLGVLFLSTGRPASSEMVDRYLKQARHARNQEQFEQADFYFRKLHRLAPDDRETLYEHALLHADRGDMRGAARLMEQLADQPYSDSERAHLWLAEQIVEGRLEVQAPLETVRHHLNQVLAKNPKSPFAHRTFAQLYLQQNQVAKAIEHLELIATFSPEAQVLLAGLYYRTGQRFRAETMARRAEGHYHKQVNEHGSAELDDWHNLAGTLLLQEKFAEAVDVLNRARTRFNDDASRVLLARAFIGWHDYTEREWPQDFEKRLKLLDQAFQLAPDEPRVLGRLHQIASAEGPQAESARQRLREALASGVAPAVIHFLFGTSAALKGDDETALRHLRQAAQINPRTAVTLNNLAFVMARQRNPDLPRALELADQAVRYAPRVASFHETRGQILVQMGRHSEGITELEFALSSVRDEGTRLGIHLSLARAYEGLGDQQLAQLHRDNARQLQQSALQPADAPGR